MHPLHILLNTELVGLLLLCQDRGSLQAWFELGGLLLVGSIFYQEKILSTIDVCLVEWLIFFLQNEHTIQGANFLGSGRRSTVSHD